MRHMPRVRVDELPALVRAIDGYDGDATPGRRAATRAAPLFTLLTWARTNETLLATWDEFKGLDGPEPLWRVPAARMKMQREHLVPLSPAVVALLADVRRYSRARYVFAGEKAEQAISQNTMTYGFYRMGYLGRQTVHGFRGLASTWANEAECYRTDWIELALAHVERNEVRGAYNTALYLTSRRRMLCAWAEVVTGMMTGGARSAARQLVDVEEHRVVQPDLELARAPADAAPRDRDLSREAAVRHLAVQRRTAEARCAPAPRQAG